MRQGLYLVLNHPHVAARSCADCRTYSYYDGPDGMGKKRLRRDNDGRMTLPVYRPLNQPTPCDVCPKVPKGARPCPESAVELTSRDWRTYVHYLRCKAVGRFPDDALVEQAAGVIRAVEDDYYLGGAVALGHKIDALVQVVVAVLRARS